MGEEHNPGWTTGFPSFLVVVSVTFILFNNLILIFIHRFMCFVFISVFWDLYCAAPERRDTCEHSSEAKAFHDYVCTHIFYIVSCLISFDICLYYRPCCSSQFTLSYFSLFHWYIYWIIIVYSNISYLFGLGGLQHSNNGYLLLGHLAWIRNVIQFVVSLNHESDKNIFASYLIKQYVTLLIMLLNILCVCIGVIVGPSYWHYRSFIIVIIVLNIIRFIHSIGVFHYWQITPIIPLIRHVFVHQVDSMSVCMCPSNCTS